MSADIQEPHVSLSREDKKNKGKKEESRAEIYENEDIFKQRHTDLGSNNVRRDRHNNPSAVHRSHFTTVSILGLLYLLILAGTFTRYILATLDKQGLLTERDQLNVSLNNTQTRILNLTEERDELQTRYDNLRNLNGHLEEERNKRIVVLKEKDQLIISLLQAENRIKELTAERNELQRKYDVCEDSSHGLPLLRSGNRAPL